MRSSVDIGKLIKKTRLRKNIQQNELAKKMGIHKSTLSKYENGSRKIDLEDIAGFANALDMTVEELMLERTDNLETVSVRTIPIVSKISAGEPLFTEENIEEYSVAPSTSIKPSKEYFYLRVSGDSMNKHFNDGDLLLVEKDSPVENGQIGVVFVNGYDATVKRIKYAEDKIYLYPESHNPEHFPQIYTHDDEIQVVGRVVSSQTFY